MKYTYEELAFIRFDYPRGYAMGAGERVNRTKHLFKQWIKKYYQTRNTGYQCVDLFTQGNHRVEFAFPRSLLSLFMMTWTGDQQVIIDGGDSYLTQNEWHRNRTRLLNGFIAWKRSPEAKIFYTI